MSRFATGRATGARDGAAKRIDSVAIELYFHHLWTHPVLDAFAEAAANDALLLSVLALAVAWYQRRPAGAVLPLAVGASCALIALFLAGLVYYEPRPFVVLAVTPLVAHDPDNAFPSDHSVAAAYAATFALFLDRRWGLVAWGAAFVLGVARIYCLLHSPADVAAGWMLGALPAAATGWWWSRSPEHTEPS